MAAREVPIPDHIDIFFLEEEFRKSDMNAIEGVIHSVQEEMKRLEAEADRVLEEDGPEAELLLDLYARLDNLDPSTFESRAAALLTGLGFSPEMMNKATKDMSGGWRMRVSFRHGAHKRTYEQQQEAADASTLNAFVICVVLTLSSFAHVHGLLDSRWPWRRRCSSAPPCCCWTSPRITWIWRPACGSRTTLPRMTDASWSCRIRSVGPARYHSAS
jgi:hypothetical protein